MSFTIFGELPVELRCQIWKQVCHITRVLDLWPQYDDKTHKITFRTSNRNPPAILYVSHEARMVGLENYKPFFGTHFKRTLGGGPLYLSENPNIYVNWASDIMCPLINPWNQEHIDEMVTDFVLALFSRLPYTRIAIHMDEARHFEKIFGHDLAWSGQHKEIVIYSMARLCFQEFRVGKPGQDTGILMVIDGDEVPLHYITTRPDSEVALSNTRKGNAVAILYAQYDSVHDGERAIHPKDAKNLIKSFSLSPKELMALNDRIQQFSNKIDGLRRCHGCDELSDRLKKCHRCSSFWYCDSVCQGVAWNKKGHKRDCKHLRDPDLRSLFLVNWDVCEDALRFPLHMFVPSVDINKNGLTDDMAAMML
ncbi:uncharacterized protein LY89DRAFT_761138 [Mollisia scopiformis]|uniref:MYND-type domain-containing protein n=1 Tax=Mollisia scopiformis TaxID=149040 RepID=A0A132BAW9_MOLSC|nr:uncharacterized protein LY89DRAFT_761138 [Mollisia scopiformis]KUJ09562.1 hypothetical protein LY89DRAFT_761138 [Mollisia scopiformis]